MLIAGFDKIYISQDESFYNDIKSVQRQWNHFAPRGNLKINTKDKSKKLQ